jgi:beta-lactam-binding protein with PASTA domain
MQSQQTCEVSSLGRGMRLAAVFRLYAREANSHVGVAPPLVLSAGYLSLLLTTGIAAAQIPPTATTVKPRVVKQIPSGVSQVQPGMVKEVPTGVLQVTPGMVMQLPPGVSEVDPRRLTEVPDLKGHRQEELPAILEKSFLYPGAVASAYSDDPVGVVTAQDPVAGRKVFRGTPVAVTVSRGPDTVPVPDVTIHSLSVARQMLARANLNVGNIVGMESEASADTVLDQRPSGGAKVSPGSSVDLTIAVAVKKVPVPGLTTLTEEAGRQRLIDAGLTEGGREERTSDEPAGTIIGQDPIAGTMVPPGTAVSRVVSAGPVMATPEEPTPKPLTLGKTPPKPPPKVPSWVIATILGAIVLAGAGYRALTKSRKPQRDEPMPGLEIRSVPDEGEQRLSRNPGTGNSIGLELHPDDDGQQRIRLQSGEATDAREGGNGDE